MENKIGDIISLYNINSTGNSLLWIVDLSTYILKKLKTYFTDGIYKVFVQVSTYKNTPEKYVYIIILSFIYVLVSRVHLVMYSYYYIFSVLNIIVWWPVVMYNVYLL